MDVKSSNAVVGAPLRQATCGRGLTTQGGQQGQYRPSGVKSEDPTGKWEPAVQQRQCHLCAGTLEEGVQGRLGDGGPWKAVRDVDAAGGIWLC